MDLGLSRCRREVRVGFSSASVQIPFLKMKHARKLRIFYKEIARWILSLFAAVKPRKFCLCCFGRERWIVFWADPLDDVWAFEEALFFAFVESEGALLCGPRYSSCDAQRQKRTSDSTNMTNNTTSDSIYFIVFEKYCF
eukprot:Nk52_evm20s281 gene=Nk52_evmTU20s281